MSTGLTYVTAYDIEATADPRQASLAIVFSDYDEAKRYVLYNAKAAFNTLFGSTQLAFIIWTSGPNQNGYVVSDSSPIFVPYD